MRHRTHQSAVIWFLIKLIVVHTSHRPATLLYGYNAPFSCSRARVEGLIELSSATLARTDITHQQLTNRGLCYYSFVCFPCFSRGTRECIMILDIIIVCFYVVIDILRLVHDRKVECDWQMLLWCGYKKKKKITRININTRGCANFGYLFCFQIILPGVPRNSIYIPFYVINKTYQSWSPSVMNFFLYSILAFHLDWNKQKIRWMIPYNLVKQELTDLTSKIINWLA